MELVVFDRIQTFIQVTVQIASFLAMTGDFVEKGLVSGQ